MLNHRGNLEQVDNKWNATIDCNKWNTIIARVESEVKESFF
jgi:hypothetical protein